MIPGASSEDAGTYACFAVAESGRIGSRALWEEVRPLAKSRVNASTRELDLRAVPIELMCKELQLRCRRSMRVIALKAVNQTLIVSFRFFHAGDGADQRTSASGISAANSAPRARGNACNHRHGQRGSPARIPMAAERCADSRRKSAYAREAQRD